MKKLLLLTLILCLVVPCFGCNQGDLPPVGSDTTDETILPAKEYKKVTLLEANSTWYQYDALKEDCDSSYFCQKCDHDEDQVALQKEITLFGKTYQLNYLLHENAEKDGRTKPPFCSDEYYVDTAPEQRIYISYVHGTDKIYSFLFVDQTYEMKNKTEEEYLREITELLQELIQSEEQKYLIERKDFKYFTSTIYKSSVSKETEVVHGFYEPQIVYGQTEKICKRSFWFDKTVYGIDTDEYVRVSYDYYHGLSLHITISDREYEEDYFKVRKGKNVKEVLDAYFLETVGTKRYYKLEDPRNERLIIFNGRVISEVYIKYCGQPCHVIIDWDVE